MMRKYISLFLKLIVIIFATYGVLLSLFASANSFMGSINALMYFTIESNILIALICMVGIIFLFFKKNIPNWWYIY